MKKKTKKRNRKYFRIAKPFYWNLQASAVAQARGLIIPVRRQPLCWVSQNYVHFLILLFYSFLCFRGPTFHAPSGLFFVSQEYRETLIPTLKDSGFWSNQWILSQTNTGAMCPLDRNVHVFSVGIHVYLKCSMHVIMVKMNMLVNRWN